jgi:hypothetical protein
MRTCFGFHSVFLTLAVAVAPLVAGCSADISNVGAESSDAALRQVGTLARAYEGTIGSNLKVMMRLDVNGSAVSGSYFYVGQVTKGETIALTGTITGAQVALEEVVLGQKTGSFEGTISAGQVRGTWKKPDGSRSLPFRLEAIKPGKVVAITRTISDAAPALEPSGIVDTCELYAEYLELFGLANANAEADINNKLAIAPLKKNADGKCEIAETYSVGQSVKLDDKGILVVEEGGSWFGGGAHPLNGMRWMNFSLASGKALTATDVFKAGSADTVKELLKQAIHVRPDVSKAALEDILLDDLEWAFKDFGSIDLHATKDGIAISLFNYLPHAAQALDESGTLLKWSDLTAVIDPASEITALVPTTN